MRVNARDDPRDAHDDGRRPSLPARHRHRQARDRLRMGIRQVGDGIRFEELGSGCISRGKNRNRRGDGS